jgi:hypothetical protein
MEEWGFVNGEAAVAASLAVVGPIKEGVRGALFSPSLPPVLVDRIVVVR